jgi:Cu+-exporting ATPase
MEARARGQAGAAIARLVGLQPKVARLVDGQEVPVASLLPGMRIALRPASGCPPTALSCGRLGVDESMLTGEPLPVAKGGRPGDRRHGERHRRAGGRGDGGRGRHGAGADRGAGRGGAGRKLPVQALVDRVTLWFVPAVMAVAVLTAAVWLVVTGDVARALVSGVAVLIIACPCAMGLAVPVSILVGTGRAAELGVLFRRGDALQRLAGVRPCQLRQDRHADRGAPEGGGGRGAGRVLPLAAAVEAQSEHPLAAAIRGRLSGWPRPRASGPAGPRAPRRRVAGRDIAVGAARMFDAVPEALAAAGGTGRGAGRKPGLRARDGRSRG